MMEVGKSALRWGEQVAAPGLVLNLQIELKGWLAFGKMLYQ
jgi:hypothetical protein